MLQEVNFIPGDVIRVHQKIQEGAKSRIQVFEGVVLGIRGRGDNRTFTVRKTTQGVAVERIWPVLSPNIEKVEVKAHSKKKIRRAKLTYMRKGVIK